MTDRFDVVVIGAGAAGMMCAAVAGQRGRSVALVDHASKLAEKIRISGGGRCNFTNRDVSAANFLSENVAFARSVLARYTPQDFVALVERHGVGWHEKHRGQLFCDESSERIIGLLVAECERGGVAWRRPVRVDDVRIDAADAEHRFRVATSGGMLAARRVVVATGGLSIPKIGATDFAYRLARRFGIPVVETRPALVPLTLDDVALSGLAGTALPVDARCDGYAPGHAPGRFREDLLITHRGLSGPAALQISSYWKPGATIEIDLLPGTDGRAVFDAARAGSRKTVANVLAGLLPARLAAHWAAAGGVAERRIAELSGAAVRALADGLANWRVRPTGTEGYRKAEVTAGGVDTRALRQGGLESEAVPGLHFIGEAVDMTGWLGGYNFQWAWASGAAAGRAA